MSDERLIRKYSNRRLYDSRSSRHVTLGDIRKMIVCGDRVKVVDDKSGEDLTRQILLQIISNQEQFGTPVLSMELLESLIRFYGDPVELRARMQASMRSSFAPSRQGAPQPPCSHQPRTEHVPRTDPAPDPEPAASRKARC